MKKNKIKLGTSETYITLNNNFKRYFKKWN